MRLVFDFDRPLKYEIKEDKSGREIFVSFLNTNLDRNHISNDFKFNNIVLKDISFNTGQDNNLNAVMKLNNDFSTNIIELDNPMRLVIDVKIFPDDNIVISNKTADSHFERGLEYENRSEYEKALHEYRRAITIGAGHPESYFHAGIIRMLNGEPEKALINFKKIQKNSQLYENAVKYVFEILDEEKNDTSKEKENLSGEDIASSIKNSEGINNDITTPDITEEAPEEEIFSSSVESVEKSSQKESDEAEKPNFIKQTPVILHLDSLKSGKKGNIKKNDYFETAIKALKRDNKAAKSATIGLSINWWYYYIIGGILSIISGFFLANKFLRKNKKTHIRKSKHIEKLFDKSVKSDIKRGRIPKNYSEKDDDKFREKLISTYSKTDRNSNVLAKSRKKMKNLLEEEILLRNSKINEILTENNLTSDVKIDYKMKNNNFTVKDKYLAVYRLYELGWDEMKIAKELHIEIEEVMLALNMKPVNNISTNLNYNFDRIYELLNRDMEISDIARELNISRGEIELAINMRKNKELGVMS